MDEVIGVLNMILAQLSETTDVLREISGKLDKVDGIYGLDDIVSHIDEAAERIVGSTGYDLTDIYTAVSNIGSDVSSIESDVSSIESDVSSIESDVSSIDTTLMSMD